MWAGHYEPGTLIWHSRWVSDHGIAECREALARPSCERRRVMSTLRAGLVAAAAIWLAELVALPRSGATPPQRAWPRGDAVRDATNALACSTVACAVLRLQE